MILSPPEYDELECVDAKTDLEITVPPELLISCYGASVMSVPTAATVLKTVAADSIHDSCLKLQSVAQTCA